MVQRLGSYLLLERLNTGGMADIYLAKQFGFGGTDQLVALKCIRPELAEDPVFIRMFVDEAKLAVLLRHANVAATYELGRIGTTYCIAMEYIQGRDLLALIERARARGVEVPEAIALQLMTQVCEGLDYAHRKADPAGVPLNIVHRDVSPHNILIGYSGEVKLIDFGIAKAATHASRSQGGVLKGKYGYMSPEQVRGQPVDCRADIFACGIVLWELLTRERLFAGASDFSVLEKVRQAEILPPSLVAPSIKPDVEVVILKALEREPSDRFASASDMRDALVQIMLRRGGQASARDLAALMASLFDAERQDELQRLERARQLTAMPADAEPLAEDTGRSDDAPRRPPAPLPAQSMASVPTRDLSPPGKVAARTQALVGGDTPVVPPVSLAPQRSAVAVVAEVRPTEIRDAYRRQHRRRDLLIVLGAVGLAMALVLGTWIATRPSGSDASGGVIITTVPPEAQVLLDGVLVGSTPFSSSAIPPGAHDVMLEKPGFAAVADSVRIVGNKVVELHVVLRPAP